MTYVGIKQQEETNIERLNLQLNVKCLPLTGLDSLIDIGPRSFHYTVMLLSSVTGLI